MASAVHLREIVQSLENKDQTQKFFLDKETCEVISGEGSDASRRDGGYLALPDRGSVDEQQFVMSFCLSLKDSDLGREFLELSQQDGGYQKFKEAIRSYSLDDAWFEFREQMFYVSAAEWCDANNIPYVE